MYEPRPTEIEPQDFHDSAMADTDWTSVDRSVAASHSASHRHIIARRKIARKLPRFSAIFLRTKPQTPNPKV